MSEQKATEQTTTEQTATEQTATEQITEDALAEQDNDFGVREFLVGGKNVILKFTAATRFRLFRDLEPSSIQGYVTSEAFKLQALALLLIGKEATGMTVDDILDALDDLGLNEVEMYKIYEWVLKRTINFMLKEAEAAAKTIAMSMPKVTELNNTLTSSQG